MFLLPFQGKKKTQNKTKKKLENFGLERHSKESLNSYLVFKFSG